MPTIWWPGISGRWPAGTSPSRRCRSVRQTPHAWTRTLTWPGPATGSATSAGRSGRPGASSSAARISSAGDDGDDLPRAERYDDLAVAELERRALVLEQVRADGGGERGR